MDRGALLKDGADVPLRPKSFKVLCYLVEHQGLLVTKRELLRAAWADVVVTEDSLTQCLIEIRKVLGDDARDMVRTVPRRGYLFDVPVMVHEPGEDPETPAEPVSLVSKRRPSRWSVGGAIVLALAIAASWWNGGMPAVEDGSPAYIQASVLPGSIAVLPFVDMSPQGDQEYFADGLSEEVLNLLAQIPELTVIARTSSFSFKGKQADIKTIAQKLNVANVLEGSVRKHGDQVRITAQLVKASNSAHLWSQTYDRTLEDVFAVQSEIAASVAAVLKVKLLGDSYSPVSIPVPHAPNAQAYQHYLRGKFFYSRRGVGDNELAMKQFEQALEIDPGLVDAWVGLAGTIMIGAYDRKTPWEESMKQRKVALDQALQLDPNHAEMHIRLFQYYWRQSELDTARQHYDQALRYGQNSALVQSIAAGIAHAEADFERAIELQWRAVALDPLGYANRGNLAIYLFSAGRFDESEVEFLNALELNPEMKDQVNGNLVQILILKQQYQQAGALVRQLPEGMARDQGMAIINHSLEQEAQSNAAIERLAANPDVEAAAYLAELYAFRGALNESFHWLNFATDKSLGADRSPPEWQLLIMLYTSPFLIPLHDDPRWAEWVADTETRMIESKL